jgi:hypothetical protein
VAGRNRFLLARAPADAMSVKDAALPAGGSVCVSGRLDDSSEPHRLAVTRVEP